MRQTLGWFLRQTWCRVLISLQSNCAAWYLSLPDRLRSQLSLQALNALIFTRYALRCRLLHRATSLLQRLGLWQKRSLQSILLLLFQEIQTLLIELTTGLQYLLKVFLLLSSKHRNICSRPSNIAWLAVPNRLWGLRLSWFLFDFQVWDGLAS